MNKTGIEWTDLTSNPIKFRDLSGRVVWGCVHTSPGCQHCYAETLAHRYGKGGPFNVQTMAKLTPFLDEKELHAMLTSKAIAGKRVFVGDMTDVFGEWVPDDLLDRLFAVMALRRDVTFQVLTKRAKRMREYLSSNATLGRVAHLLTTALQSDGTLEMHHHPDDMGGIMIPNIWLGVSCEDQQRADERIPHLLQTPAAVRFVSAEPLLGPVNFSRPQPEGFYFNWLKTESHEIPSLDWVIVGGESGPGARPCAVEWVRGIVAQCEAAGTACFVKQLGSKPVFGFEQNRMKQSKGKGPVMAEWPSDLRVRSFPAEP